MSNGWFENAQNEKVTVPCMPVEGTQEYTMQSSFTVLFIIRPESWDTSISSSWGNSIDKVEFPFWD